MKTLIKNMNLLKTTSLVCIILISLLFSKTKTYGCTIDTCYYDPINLSLHLHTDCPLTIVRINYQIGGNVDCKLAWNGITDANGDIQITTDESIDCAHLALQGVENIAGRMQVDSSLLPVGRASYTGSFDGKFFITNNDIIEILAANHSEFSKGTFPKDSLNSLTIDSFTSVADFIAQLNGVGVHLRIPADVLVRLNCVKKDGSATYYVTEMKKLDINCGSGGGGGAPCPSNYMIRESPTELSSGVTIIDSSAAGIFIQSYFDLRMEISTDGVNWVRSCSTGLMVMKPNDIVPTLSQWAMILLGALLLCTGVLYISKR